MIPLLDRMDENLNKGTRTKVAVIDTGIDPGDPLIRGAKGQGRIPEVRNWVPGKDGVVKLDDVIDTFGHGTHVAALVLKVAPCADICVARVAGGKLLESGEKNIAEVAHFKVLLTTRAFANQRNF
jgi:subtilisin family serine protease